MSQKKMRMIKMILGAYLMVVGILLSIDVYDQKPGNMQLVFVVASILIIVGFFYLIQDIRKALEKSMIEKAKIQERKNEEEKILRHQELHSSDKFRTAPMPVVKPVKLEKAEENTEENLEEFDEKTIILTNFEEEHSDDGNNKADEKIESEKPTINIEESVELPKEENKQEDKEEK